MLVFNLKKEWFEKIKSGKKTIEYREVKPYWTSRLRNATKCVSYDPFDFPVKLYMKRIWFRRLRNEV